VRRFRLACVVVTALTVGCQRAGEDALLIGRLFGDPSVGCVWVGRPQGGLEIDWPLLYDVDPDAVRVSGPGFVAEEGDWFRMTGGTRPDARVSPSCPASVSRSGRFVPAGIEYFGDVKPPAVFGAS
jgi:hypothetical protein